MDIDFADRDGLLWFLAHHDVTLPGALTVEDPDVPEETVDEMLAVLKQTFRRRTDVE